jgi:hypothetical protein
VDVVEAGASGKFVQGGVDVGAGVAGEGEDFELPAVAGVSRAVLHTHRRVNGAVGAVVEDGL